MQKKNNSPQTSERKDFKFEFKKLDEKGYFEGYAATFGNVDFGNDVIEKGAFAKAIRDVPVVKILWQHEWHNPIGKSVTMREDDHGLFVAGQLTRGVAQAEDAYLLMKDKVIDALSIGYGVVEKVIKDDVRYLKELTLHEFSPVTFAMNDHAIIHTVKGCDMLIAKLKGAKSEREAEKVLREAGLHSDLAKYIANRLPNDTQREVDALKKLLSSINIIKGGL